MKSQKPTKRCRECGAKCTHLDDNCTCYGCAVNTKIKQKGSEQDLPTPKKLPTPKTMEHPSIKNS